MRFTSILLLLAVGSLAQGAPSLINLLPFLAHCPSTAPAVAFWNGTTFVCATLGPGISASKDATTGVTSIVAGAANPPAWQAETVTLSALAAGSTSISYATTKPPISGVVFWWYNSANLLTSASGAVVFTGAPLTFTLPAGWSPTDSISVAYQSQ